MRVVSLTCSNTEIVAFLGLGDMLVGVDDHSDWPGTLVDPLPRLGPDLTIDVDAVAALEPDLVLASLTVPGHERVVEALEARGLPLLVPAPKSLADVAADIRDIGAALGHAARGDAVARGFEAGLEAHTRAPGDVPVLVEWWPRPVYTPGRQSWVTDLLVLAGGRNPFAHHDVPSLAVDTADVVREAPEAIVISWCGVPTAKYRPDIVRRREGWGDVPAVRDGRITPIAEAWLGRPGPRLVDGLRALGEVVTSAREASCR
ncbi:MAG: cobalamin-binding protein [Alphaproteobacteria bacterium]|nr:cobalamin-binding protein [Alphaproteobacteria bacterium]